MFTRITQRVRPVAAAVALAALSASAWAQDYTITQLAGLLEARPSGATILNVNSTQSAAAWSTVTLPFNFSYYTRTSQTAVISAHGWLIPGATSGFGNAHLPQAAHGADPTTGAFGPGTNSADGIITPYWSTYHFVNDGSANTGYVYTWTVGSAPNRRFVISWENVAIYSTSNTRLTVQTHLYEGTGRVVMAYSSYSASAYAGATFVLGLDSPIDLRFSGPAGPGSHQGNIGADWIFDPRIVTLSGTLLYDRIVSDASGIGNSVQSNLPAAGCRAELRRSDGLVYASTTIATDGGFSMTLVGPPGATPGVLHIVAAHAACNVLQTGGTTPVSWAANSSVSFTSNQSLGTMTLGSAADASTLLRGALNVARVCGAAHEWAAPRISSTVPVLTVRADPNGSSTTGYYKADLTNPAQMWIGNALSGNSDVWDDAIITRTYARHLLASITAPPLSTPDYRFDAVTNTQNAFAEGFGYSVWAAISGSSQAIDGKSASAATVYDLENPTIASQKGDDVAGRLAAALVDLVDGANETIDRVDGTAAADRVLRAADSLTTTPIALSFLQAWVDLGYDAAGITRAFAGNGVLRDDAVEPNDLIDESTPLGPVGVLRPGLVLNRFTEDWFAVELGESAASLFADAKYDTLTTGATIAVDIHDAAGVRLATGILVTATGAFHAQTGAVPAGTYRIGVRHLSGGIVPAYDFQAYVPPSMDAVPVHDWTVGRPYDFPLGARDGIAPYRVSASSGALPPGLVYDSASSRVFGTPSTVGSFALTTQLVDSGAPANIIARSATVTVHDVLKIAIAPFAGFPAGRAVDTTLPTTGGTQPFTLTMTSGSLPAGLTLASNSLHVTGSTATQRDSAFEVDGVDVAGSSDHVAARAVVAVELNGKGVLSDLAAGDAACGWWFDAVQGSTVSFGVATAKGRVKRTLAGVLLAPDRSAVATGTIKARRGSVKGVKLLCPESGRYYVIASSADGEATQLAGNLAVTPPKSGNAKLADFAPTDTTTIEIGALPGAKLTVKFRGDKKPGFTTKVVSVYDPSGVGIAFGPLVKTVGLGGTLTMDLPIGGTWIVTLGAKSTSGKPGKLSYSYSIKQPKGGTYSAE